MNIIKPVSAIWNRARGIILTALFVGVSVSRADFNYQVSFDQPDPNFRPRTVGPDFKTHADGLSVTMVEGKLRLARAAGSIDGSAGYDSTFQLLGDFEASVTCSRAGIGFAEAGLLGASDLGFFDAFFASESGVNAVIVIGAAPNQGVGLQNSSATVSFRLRRVDTTLFSEFSTGPDGPFSTLLSFTHADYAGPMSIGLFLLELHNFSGSNEATFDDLTIHAAGVIPLLQIAPAGPDVILSWPKDAVDFKLESGEALPAGVTWTPVTAPAEIIGQQTTVRQTASATTRFYRLANLLGGNR